jgi:hypothetical protein
MKNCLNRNPPHSIPRLVSIYYVVGLYKRSIMSSGLAWNVNFHLDRSVGSRNRNFITTCQTALRRRRRRRRLLAALEYNNTGCEGRGEAHDMLLRRILLLNIKTVLWSVDVVLREKKREGRRFLNSENCRLAEKVIEPDERAIIIIIVKWNIRKIKYCRILFFLILVQFVW